MYQTLHFLNYERKSDEKTVGGCLFTLIPTWFPKSDNVWIYNIPTFLVSSTENKIASELYFIVRQ